MKPSKITKKQAVSIARAGLYVGVSAAIAKVTSDVANDPDLFGTLTPLVNVALVTLKQLFTK